MRRKEIVIVAMLILAFLVVGCGTVYELDPEIGKMIARGEEVEILPSHLTQVSGGRGFAAGYKRCRQCGYETTEDFDYCPKCGTRF